MPTPASIESMRLEHERREGRRAQQATARTARIARNTARYGKKPAAQTKIVRGLSPAGAFRRKMMQWMQGSLFQQLQGEQASANKANLQRYYQALAQWNQVGQAEMQTIGRNLRQGQAMGRQSLINRGLGNTTVVGPMMNRMQESADISRLNVRGMVARGKAGIIERRTDLGPNMQAYGQALRAWGQTGRPVD